MQTEKKRPAQSKNEQTSLLQYHGSDIAFQEIDGKLMVNATQMAKSFGKRPVDWLNTQQAQELLGTFVKVRNHTLADLKQVRRGGKNPGTWFHEDIALLFAQWLSPEFYIACNDKLKELITQQALIAASPIKYDITGLIHEGKAVYPYGEACKKLGNVKFPKASKRKALHGDHFIKLYGRNFITEYYLDLLKGYYDYKNAQLKLSI